MTLLWQIQIIDGLIKENPESTIKDYVELLAELSKLEQEVEIKESTKYKRA